MNRNKAILLVVIQITLVLSIAGKYLYERKTCPRVWVRTEKFDPNLPLRGRYVSLQLMVDACGLPRDENARIRSRVTTLAPQDSGFWRWQVKPTARDGKLVAIPATPADRPENTEELLVWADRMCSNAALSKSVEYFIADTARSPFPLQPGQELWVEVTVPPMGPPRPIQLAASKDGVFTPLKLD